MRRLAAGAQRSRRPAPWSTPAGICSPKTPAKMRSVAWPRIFGPTAVSATLTTASTSHDDHEHPLRAQPAEQPLGRRAEVLRLLARLADPHGPAGPAAGAGWARAAPRRPSPPRS